MPLKMDILKTTSSRHAVSRSLRLPGNKPEPGSEILASPAYAAKAAPTAASELVGTSVGAALAAKKHHKIRIKPNISN